VSAASVYIVEERPQVRTALADRLGRSPEIQVAGQQGEAQAALSEIEETRPDAILLEVKRADGMGLEILRRLAALPDRPKIIVLTSYPASWERQSAERTGADAYVLKEIESEELIRLILDLVGA
jgi:DNA-binding NarL/FixJ family response regulator